MTETDAELVGRASRGDKDAFEKLVRNHEKRVYTLALRMSHNREDAFDLSQEVFLRVYRTLPSFRGEASFSTWLYRLAYNLCLDHARKMKNQREQSFFDRVDDDDEDRQREHEWSDLRYSPEIQWEKKELADAIAQAMDRLTAEQRAILTLREIQGFTYGEIADVLKLPSGTVKSRLARAREALREILMSKGNFFAPETSKSSKGR